jgi:peptidoglycan/LPS O-acetylase OafA/YrhL
MRHRLDSLDLGRFIAALVVMFDHFFLSADTGLAKPGASLFWGLNSPGALAVQYFFTLSGFVMLTAHRRDFGHWLAPFKFWWRRASRIFPVFWISLIFPLCFYHASVGWSVIWQQFLLEPWLSWDAIYPAWSLHYETAFYIMFGLVLIPRAGLLVLAGWIGTVLLFWWPWPVFYYLILLKQHLFAWLHLTGPTCFISPFELWFFCGLASAFMFLYARLPGRWGWVQVAGGLVMVVVSQGGSNYGMGYPSLGFQLCCAAGFGSIIYGMASLEAAGALRLGAWAARLGSCSYPLYMINAPVLLACEAVLHGRKLGNAGLYGLLTVEVLLMVVATYVLTFWIDVPLQRFLRNVGRQRVAASPVQTN